jgi:hypothetical protein
MMIFRTKKRYEDFYFCGTLKNIFNIDKGLDILSPGRFRPGPPRNTKTTFGWFFFRRPAGQPPINLNDSLS